MGGVEHLRTKLENLLRTYYLENFHIFTPYQLSGLDASPAKNTSKRIPTANNIKPRKMHFLAFGRSSFLIAKYAIIAPTIPKKIGKRYHQLLLGFSGYIILGYFFGLF